ncbi:IS630 family transposase [Leptospira alstonii]|uniref:DNA-binding helix-turn-helix protein n=1 Tax=Leptospira alstonii serovar Sichuan str. 79601 TaxID=1218565 RepID=M6D2H4_9LEPT|nr:IS630 family transposase [Leptospira alstonii]AGS80539.1 DNA-binding helix-turn-helix protein [Leptospira phage vB_LalZ_80412-LE1]EMJ95383.1 DNA-binding helix-turn-helix protein [Leptospira alstonii serovar Sichuan str. 79601]
MDIDARKIGRKGQEKLRRLGVQRVLEGESPKAVSESLKLGRKTIFVWLKKYKEDGEKGLIPGKAKGKAPLLNAKQKQRLSRMIVGKDPRQWSLSSGLWTRKLVSELIMKEFGIKIGLTAVGNLLHSLNITPQKPLKVAYQRDPQAVKEWMEVTYPLIRKNAKKTGAEIYFTDETGIRSDSTVGRTWGRKGDKVILKDTGVRSKVNAISAVNISGAFWYQTYTGKFTGSKFVELLKDFMKYRKKKVFLILDGHPTHKAKEVKEYLKLLNGKLEFYFLPGYSPDLNPDEFVWNHLKTNLLPKRFLGSNDTILYVVQACLQSIKANAKLVRSFFLFKSVSYLYD